MFNTLKPKTGITLKNSTSFGRWLLIGVLVIFAFIYALPNLFLESPAIQISAKDSSEVSQTLVQQVEAVLSAAKIDYRSISIDQSNLTLKFSSTDTQMAAEEALTPALQDKYIIALNLIPNTPKWLQFFGANPMKLGLDLRGGMYFLLNIDMQVVIQNHLQNDVTSLISDLRTANIRYANIVANPQNNISLNFRTVADQQAAVAYIASNYQDLQIVSAADLNITAALTPAEIKLLQDNAVQQTLEVMRNRVNELGVAEATVAKESNDRVVVELPGLQDATRAKSIIGGTATLKAMLVNENIDPNLAAKGELPPGSSLYYDQKGQPVVLYDHVIITGNAVSDANVGYDPQTNLPVVQVKLQGPQVAYFSEITGQNVGHSMAIVLVQSNFSQELVNGQQQTVTTTTQTVISVANILQQLSNNFQISGIGNQRAAQNLALSIRAGALPAPVQIAEEKQIGPSLGVQNIKMGALSVLVALALVILFIAFYYHVFGLIADLCLLLNLVFIVAVMSLLPGATMTLPGIAGIVLNVGIAIDANVLIFERIREELRKGSSNALAIHLGYERAFATILDANVTTFMVAIILFAIGTGAVKGFAVTLMIGIVTSMFCGVVISRAFINLIYGKHPSRKLSIGI